ncbi:hypothetical protein V6N13_029084 [Hibiscus sabdariffa]
MADLSQKPKSLKTKSLTEFASYYSRPTMGIIKSCFSFIAGTVCGIYVAQNYNAPNIKKLADSAFFLAKHIEEKYRKPKNKDGD